MEERLWPNTGIPLTSHEWVGGMFALSHETLSRIDASSRQPDGWFTPLRQHLVPVGKENTNHQQEFDILDTADV